MNTKYIFLILLLAMVACEPTIDDQIELGTAPSSADFSITELEEANTYQLTNLTNDVFIIHWETSGNSGDGLHTGETIELLYPLKGAYEVKMTVFNEGGSTSISKTITVLEDLPFECTDNVELLSDCGEKTWKLKPMAAAFQVQSGETGEVWWSNAESDVDTRSCIFNDEFSFLGDGSFVYDNQGDFWADSDNNDNVIPADLGVEPGCQSSSIWPEQYQAWNSGTHQYSVTGNQLSVIGEGAFMGLYKAATNTEVTEPQQSVTYKIVQLDDTLLVLQTQGSVVWQYIYQAQ